MGQSVMDDFERFLSNTDDVPRRRVPHYLRWVRRAYEIAGQPLDAPLSAEAETKATIWL